MGRKKLEVCRLCGWEGALSEEHSPPESAFNKEPHIQIVIDHRTTDEVLFYRKKKQAGSWVRTLCKSCNENTGSWYVRDDYTPFVKAIAPAARRDRVGRVAHFELSGVRPSRILKEVVTMMCATSGPEELERLTSFRGPSLTLESATVFDSPPAVADPETAATLKARYDELRRYALDPEARGLPESVRIFACILPSHGMKTGLVASSKPDGSDVRWFVGHAHRPIAWVMTLDGHDWSHLAEFTGLAELGPDDRVTLGFEIPVLELEQLFGGSSSPPRQVEENAP